MIHNREHIQAVRVGIKPMRIVVSDTISTSAKQTMLKNDPERREPKHIEDVILMPSRFAALVDQYGNVLNTVTPRTYNLIHNSEIIAALDLVSDQVNMDLHAKSSAYYSGRSMWRFTLPEAFYVPGDESPHFGMIDVWHDSRGTGGLSVGGGIFRQWCTNGCTTKIVGVERASTNHRKETNLMEFFQETMEHFANQVTAFQQIHQRAGEVQIDLRNPNRVREALASVYRTLAPRYRPRLSETIRRYTAEAGSDRDAVGRTVHALIQSVSDVATHQMQDGVTRHNWAHNATEALVDALLESVG